ncbi:MAG: RNA polymerase sigma factor, partial [Ignavibacteria bacterium]
MCQDTNLFIKLLKTEYSDALKYCKALCVRQSPDDAEDVLQQSLLKALENFDKLNDHSKFKSWFFKIITREFYNSVRKSFWKKFLPLESSPEAEQMPETFDRTEEDDEMKILLYHALSQISVKERSAVLLFEIGGFSIEEIREMQNEKSVSAVKSRLSRSREKLKRFITENTNVHQSKKSSIILGDLRNETIKL